jgi:hypothetical protein
MEDSHADIELEKFDVFNHLASIVLSLLDSRHSFGLMSLLQMSINIEVTEAMN